MKKMKGTTQPSSHACADPIPLSIILEILSRLPTKSIVRFRSVSKLWSSITTTPQFTKAHISLASATLPCVLLLFRKQENLYAFASPRRHNDLYSPRMEEFQSPYVDDYYYDSVDGLICMETPTEIMIWNHTMRHRRFLPYPFPSPKGSYKRVFLGHDPNDGKYKVICLFSGVNIGILTLGEAQESWRIISQGIPKHSIITTSSSRCINGVIYYQAFMCSNFNRAIMCFDLASETLSMLKYPAEDVYGFIGCHEGRLALACCESYSRRIELWILEDAVDQKWMYKRFCTRSKTGVLKGLTDAGEFVFIRPTTPPTTTTRTATTTTTVYSGDMWGFINGRGPRAFPSPAEIRASRKLSFAVEYFDPKKNKIRQVSLGGIGCDDVRRLDEIGFDPNWNYSVSVIPNHIDTSFVPV